MLALASRILRKVELYILIRDAFAHHTPCFMTFESHVSFVESFLSSISLSLTSKPKPDWKDWDRFLVEEVFAHERISDIIFDGVLFGMIIFFLRHYGLWLARTALGVLNRQVYFCFRVNCGAAWSAVRARDRLNRPAFKLNWLTKDFWLTSQ